MIGTLDLDIAGEASAITQLASYEPIDAMARTGMTPGRVFGRSFRPCQRRHPADRRRRTKDLSWLVSLDYEDLALTKPIEGQIVSEAAGNITVDPKKAVIKAKAKLNGAPAEIDIVEPIGDGGPKRSRNVEMVLDDEAREELAPGMGSAGSRAGQREVHLRRGRQPPDRGGPDRRQARYSLGGLEQGAGHCRQCRVLADDQRKVDQADDLELRGKSFAIDGDITLSAAALSSARLKSVRLNRDDDASVTIDRKGKGFKIGVTGNSLDVRAIVKMLKADPARRGRDQRRTRPISIDAKLGRLTGFHDETLTDVTLSYDGSGLERQRVPLQRSTKSGAAVALQDETEGGTRTMQMQSADAGAVLRFLDIYEHMVGRHHQVCAERPGRKDADRPGRRPRISSSSTSRACARIVSTAPQGDGRSLNEAVKRDIDTSRVTSSAALRRSPRAMARWS